MKVTIEFEHWHELRAILAGLASVIEIPDPICDTREPMTPAEMMAQLRPFTKTEIEK